MPKTKDETEQVETKTERAVDEQVQLTAEITIKGIPDVENGGDELEALQKDGDLIAKGLEYGEIEVIVSNSATDRHGESILLEGIDLSQIRRNPVVLWAHDYTGLPIGQIKDIRKKGGNLVARIKLDYDVYEFADTVYKLILRGTINAVSIGGMVREWNDDYTVVKKLEMVELSVVPVGAHPDALVVARSVGIRPEDVKKQFTDFVKATVLDKYKGLSETDFNNHVKFLEDFVKLLKEAGPQNAPVKNETPEQRKVKLITLKRVAAEATHRTGEINKTIKIVLKGS